MEVPAKTVREAAYPSSSPGLPSSPGVEKCQITLDRRHNLEKMALKSGRRIGISGELLPEDHVVGCTLPLPVVDDRVPPRHLPKEDIPSELRHNVAYLPLRPILESVSVSLVNHA